MQQDLRQNANRVRCHRTPGVGHVESHFLKANSPDGQRAIWLKHTAFVPTERARSGEGEVWAIAFDRNRPGFPRGVRLTHPLASIHWSESPFQILTPTARLEEGVAVGAVKNDNHEVQWELTLQGDHPPLFPFPWKGMYQGSFPKQKTVSPFPNAIANGEVRVDGEVWDIAGWPAMQGHNWGRGHSDHYAWIHSNLWSDEKHSDAWFEGFCGKVMVGPIMTPWLSMAVLHVEGETYRFDRPSSLLSRGNRISNSEWAFDWRQGDMRLSGSAQSPQDAMAGLHYGNPDQSTTYCLNSKLAHLKIEFSRRGAPPIQLISEGAALEIGTKDPSHGVRMLL